MSVSQSWIRNPVNLDNVYRLYKQQDPLLSQQEIADILKTTHHNVMGASKVLFTPEERHTLKSMRLSRAKLAELNPMKGKYKEQHHNYIGDCENGYGYLTRMHNGTRQLSHRVIMAQALGLDKLPENLHVHHINDDKHDNRLDNLALTTQIGHHQIHFLQGKDSKRTAAWESTLAAYTTFMTSE